MAGKPKYAEALQIVQLAINRLSVLEQVKEVLHAAVDAEAVKIEAETARDALRREVEALRHEQQGLQAAIRKLYEEERQARPRAEARMKEAENDHARYCTKLKEDMEGLKRQKAELDAEVQRIAKRFLPAEP